MVWVVSAAVQVGVALLVITCNNDAALQIIPSKTICTKENIKTSPAVPEESLGAFLAGALPPVFLRGPPFFAVCFVRAMMKSAHTVRMQPFVSVTRPSAQELFQGTY